MKTFFGAISQDQGQNFRIQGSIQNRIKIILKSYSNHIETILKTISKPYSRQHLSTRCKVSKSGATCRIVLKSDSNHITTILKLYLKLCENHIRGNVSGIGAKF